MPKSNAPKIQLGDRARDRITGLTGIVIGRTTWLRNCDRLTLQPEDLHDGRPVDVVSFDEPDLELIEAGVIEYTPITTGGPRPEVRRHHA